MPARGRWWLGVAALVAVGALVSPKALPLYDGVGFPDEPYRYVAPPPGVAATAPPTVAMQVAPLVGGKLAADLIVNTAEQGPQFSLSLGPGAVLGTGSAVVRAVPLAPDTGPVLDGNVYRVTVASGSGAALAVAPVGSAGLLVLRATTARQPGPVVEHRSGAGAPWAPLATQRGGQDIYSTPFAGAGDYALSFAAGGPAAAGGGGGGPVIVGVLAGVVLLLAALILVVRRRARRTVG